MKPEQITAWALDEASPEERQQLEAELRENPQTQQTAAETQEFCHFLLAELRDESLALTDAQRDRLKAAPTLPPPALPAVRAARPAPRWRTALRLAMAAALVLGGVWLWTEVEGHRQVEPMPLAEATDARYKVSRPPFGDETGWGGLAAPEHRQSTNSPSPQNPTPAAPLAVVPGVPGLPALGVLPPGPAQPLANSTIVFNGGAGTMTAKDVAELKKIQDTAAYGVAFGGARREQTASASASGNIQLAVGGVMPNQSAVVSTDAVLGGWATRALPDTSTSVLSEPGTSTLTMAGEPYGKVVEFDGYVDATSSSTLASDAAYFTPAPVSKMEKESTRADFHKRNVASAESYTRIVENVLKDVAREPLSTFSIDVDTAAYANMRRFLNQGVIPPADAVRIEELVNYFPTAEEGPVPQAKEPFGVRVELAPCPWLPEHRLARIAIKGRELGNERKASNLVFLVDVSGSMNEPAKLPLVQQSLRMLTEQLGEEDRVTMVVYAGSSGLVLPPTNGVDKTAILAAIDKLRAGGSTHGSAGIQLAYEQAVANFIKGGVNRVILCTDGDFNVGVSSPEELEKLITRKAKSGVFLSVLGFGSGNLQDRTMETLADKGNGNYAYIDSLSEARKVLVEQMSGTLVTIAKDVKIQVEFNPAAVRSYRLIGYENRLMAKEDFNDDTKDAGEIGAGHSVVALYELVPTNLPAGAEPRPVVDGLRYQTQAPAAPPPTQLAEAAKTGEVMTVKLRYKEPDSSLSKLIEVPAKDEGKTLTASSEEYKFSAAVAGFGLLLRDSTYKGTLRWETVRKLALDGKGADKLGYRGEFLQLIDKARGLKEGQP